MLNAATWLMNLGVAVGAMLAGRSLVHYFQLESYQFPGYYRTLKRNAARAVLPGCLMTLAAVVAALLHGAAAERCLKKVPAPPRKKCFHCLPASLLQPHPRPCLRGDCGVPLPAPS